MRVRSKIVEVVRSKYMETEMQTSTTYWAYRCRHYPYRHCTFDVENDGACDDDDVSFRLVDARPHTPCALCDLEADERELASLAPRIDVPMIIDNKNSYKRTETEIHIIVFPPQVYIFSMSLTWINICYPVASFRVS